MQLEKHIDELRQWIMSFFAEKQRPLSPNRCCISLSSREINIILIKKTPAGVEDSIQVLLSEMLKYDDMESLKLVLTGMIERYEIEHVPTYWLLTPADYQIFLIDSLAVESNEFHDALTWRLRSVLPYPTDEATIDYFMLPPRKTTANNPMIAAVAAKQSQLKSIIDIFASLNLNLTAIDIPELALRNLANMGEKDERSTAMIYFYEKLAILNITHKQTLYFTRHINLYLENETKLKTHEELCLDILRYFDYFQSQWRLPSPTRIFVSSQQMNATEIAEAFSKHLLLSVEPFSLASFVEDSAKSRSLEKNFLLALGCALRKDEVYAKTGN